MSDEVVLTATGLRKVFQSGGSGTRVAVEDVSFTLHAGETLGVVGESGSGKSTLARLVLGLERPTAGVVRLDGQDWSDASERDRRPRRTTIQFVPQDPLSSFDPRCTVRQILTEALSTAGPAGGAEVASDVPGLLAQVGLDTSLAARRPATLSGGQRQRVAIARALAPRPRIIVCDEPVSAMDVGIQAEVLRLLEKLRDRFGIAYLFISHDLAVIEQVSDRLLVMRGGRVVESGDTATVLRAPKHECTRALVAAVPRLPDLSQLAVLRVPNKGS